ncbi:MAG: DUF1599 domain-containing protein [Saprospiraceae bacterium]|nr:DUF1599 domain-containing protein [Saprospiraceae bacterium]
MADTTQQYDMVSSKCRALFVKKMHDYGTAWRVLRLSSLVDQILIKTNRIRTLEESEEQRIEDSIDSEYVGIVNYSLMALIQLDLGHTDTEGVDDAQDIQQRYDDHAQATRQLMLAKNHDYGEAWRLMSPSSLTDMILMKIYRLKQIIQNDGNTLVSEGIEANFMDMINYAIFALIKLQRKFNTA